MRALKWIYAQFNELIAVFFTFFFAPLSLMKDKWTGATNDKPILLIHGYCNYSSVWIYHIMRFLSADLGPIYTVDLGYPFDSIENYAEKVKQKVEKIQKETGVKTVNLVGHSMGGLVASFYALNLQSEPSVEKIITLGTPFKGTKMAKLAMGECGRQMRIDSEFGKKLYEQVEKSKDIEFYHIAAGSDQIVVPYTSALVGEANDHLIFDDLGHVALLFSPMVSREVVQWLTTKKVAVESRI